MDAFILISALAPRVFFLHPAAQSTHVGHGTFVTLVWCSFLYCATQRDRFGQEEDVELTRTTVGPLSNIFRDLNCVEKGTPPGLAAPAPLEPGASAEYLPPLRTDADAERGMRPLSPDALCWFTLRGGDTELKFTRELYGT